MLRNRRKRVNRFESEDVNPMDSVSNLSDAMLILAVGIMLALIMHGQIQMKTSDATESQDTSSENAISFTGNDLENKEELPENMQRMGDVFYDPETGTYYIVENSGSGE